MEQVNNNIITVFITYKQTKYSSWKAETFRLEKNVKPTMCFLQQIYFKYKESEIKVEEQKQNDIELWKK